MQIGSGKESFSLLLFFTWDVSLEIWKTKGLLDREMRYYEALAQRGIKVTLITWGEEEDYKISSGFHPNIKTIPVYTLMHRSNNQFVRALMSPFILWKARVSIRKANFLKTNQMWGAWCAVLSKLLFRKPLIVRTGFELYHFTCKQNHSWIRRLFIYLLSFFSYKMADKIYVATKEDQQFVSKKFFIKKEDLSIRPNWIDIEAFRPLEMPEKQDAILFVGRLTHQKNLPLLIDAVENTHWSLDIVGDGEMMLELKKLAAQKKASIRFLGSLPNSELPRLYNTYPVFVLPSFYEGNPKTLLEAMACGRAVIGTKVTGIQSVIKDGKSGFLCHPSAHALKKAISQLMENKDLRNSLGALARKQIQEDQTLDSLIQRELKDYNNFCES